MSQPVKPISELLTGLWRHISRRRRKQLALLLLLMSVTSFAEVLSIGAVIPFLGILTAPESVFNHPVAQSFISLFGFSESSQLLLPLTFTFGVAALLAGSMRLLLLWATTRLSYATGADLSISIYRRTLYQSYAIHVSRNSSDIITAISSKVSVVINNMIMPVITLTSSSFMIAAILAALLSVNATVAILAMGGFATVYLLIVTFSRRQLLANSQRIAKESSQVIKSLQEGLGGIRDVLIDGSQEIYSQIYRSADLPLRRAQGNNAFIGQSPRFAMEALGMLLIAALAFILSREDNGISNGIPVLGALALGAQRLLPVFQQAYTAWSGIQGGRASLQDTLELLDQPLPVHAGQRSIVPISFNRQIELNNISFRYQKNSSWVIRNLNLVIRKGSRIGFIGTTGSGKSTLIDIVMGLLEPSEGELLIDGEIITLANHRQWQAHIAHVPQSIFLADASIEENVAFGIARGKADKPRVVDAVQRARLADYIETLPNKYQTMVGERGVRLSGGQRQRIGIARALYKRADVIVFDEATSALDNETEKAVMKSIEGLGKELTILIVAHRLTTLQDCDQVVELEDGAVKRIGTYQDLLK